MGNCFVPGCRSGTQIEISKSRKDVTKIPTLFSPPTDVALLQKWKDAISSDKDITKNHRVCELHFREEDIARFYTTKLADGSIHRMERGRPMLRHGVIPSIFPNLERNISEITMKKTMPIVHNMVAREENMDVDHMSPVVNDFFTYKKLCDNVQSIKLPSDWWSIAATSTVIICAKWNKEYIPEKRVVIKNDLSIRLFLREREVPVVGFQVISCVDDVSCILETVDSFIICESNIHDISSFNLERTWITVKGKLKNIAKCTSQTCMYFGVHPPWRPMSCPVNSFPPSMDLQKETVYVYIPNFVVDAIIGRGGTIIRHMINASGASMKVTRPNKDDPIEKLTERKVCIIGSAEAQSKAQFMLFKEVASLIYPGYQEAILKVEIFVPTSQVGRIIGKRGQTVRELQRATYALIEVPEDGQCPETEETAIHIIGDFYCSKAAQRQIRCLVYKSSAYQQRRRMSQQSLPSVQN